MINQPLVPTATAPGGPGFTLAVHGTGFVSGAVVNWKGSARPTIFISSSELTATIFASDIAAPGTASISVENPGSGGSSNVLFFSITESQPASPAPTFANVHQALPFANYANAVAGDFNGDDKLDLAGLVPLATTNPVFVLLGNGNGTFQSPVIINTGQDASVTAVGDFNGDGRLDLAIFGNTAASILLGNGDGTFQSPKPFAPGFNPGSPANVAMADFNGDGKLDLALTEPGANSVSIFLGNGDGTFQNPTSYTNSPHTPPPGTCCGTVGDFNGDGKLDLAFIDSAGIGIDVLFGNGDGTFQQPSFQGIALTPVGCTNGSPLSSIIAADLNGDDKLDLVASCLTGRFQWGDLLLGQGDGTFQKDSGYEGEPGFAIGDFNADGRLDLLTEFCGSESTQVCNPPEILFGNGDGSFGSATVSSLPDFAAGANPSMPVVGDFNGDGKLDLAFLSNNSVNVFLHGPQDFSLAPASQSAATIAPGQSATFELTVVSISGFSGAVAFTCSGAPLQSTCVVSPTSVNLDGATPSTIRVTLATTASSVSISAPWRRLPPFISAYLLKVAGVLLLMLTAFLVFQHSPRSRLVRVTAWSLVLCIALAVAGCASTHNSGSTLGGNLGTPRGSYTLTVSGSAMSSSMTMVHSTNLTLIVQ